MEGIQKHGEGENIGFFAPSRPKCEGKARPDCYFCGETVEQWYKEIENYDFKNGKSSNGKTYLHFTQVNLIYTTGIQQ